VNPPLRRASGVDRVDTSVGDREPSRASQLDAKSEVSVGARTGTRPRGSDSREAVAACDVCGAPLARGERRRLVWDSALGGELVLADLCSRCAGQADRLIEMYGGRGRNNVRLTRANPVSALERAPVQRLGGSIVRGVVYVLIAVATFVVVTFVTSRR
jgi:hypothetical protein